MASVSRTIEDRGEDLETDFFPKIQPPPFGHSVTLLDIALTRTLETRGRTFMSANVYTKSAGLKHYHELLRLLNGDLSVQRVQHYCQGSQLLLLFVRLSGLLCPVLSTLGQICSA